MSFLHSEAHDSYRENVERWVNRTVRPALTKIGLDAPLGESEAVGLLRQIDRDGFTSALVRDERGAPDWIAFGIVLEEMARASAPLAQFLVDKLATGEGIRMLLSPAQLERYADALSGRVGVAAAFTETGAGSSQREMRTMAVKQGDHWVINGTKTWISGGSHAAAAILACRTREPDKEDGFGLFFIERGSGWSASDIPMLGFNIHPTSEIVLADFVVPDIARIEPQGNALANVQMLLKSGRCFMSVLSLGIARSAYDAALAYSRERTQRSKPIAGFQLIQSMLVDMLTDIECGSLLAWRAFAGLADGRVTPLEASMSKMFCTEMCVRVASNAIQIHGAMGLAREAGVERIFRDARMMTIPDGTSQIQKLIIGREITGISALRG